MGLEWNGSFANWSPGENYTFKAGSQPGLYHLKKIKNKIWQNYNTYPPDILCFLKISMRDYAMRIFDVEYKYERGLRPQKSPNAEF